VVLSPHITEKGTIMSNQNKYVFRVAEGANKVEIKKAITSLYKVDVAKVRVSYARSKIRQVGRREGHKPGFKKAIVTLKERSKIDLAA
jgi:large subunit ribosomal protein L23